MQQPANNTTTAKHGMKHVAYWAVVPAAGIGRRMQPTAHQQPKQYLPLRGKTVIEHAIERLLALPLQSVLVAINPTDAVWATLPASRANRVETVHGGEERHHSVLNGLLALNGRAADNDWVLVHDAARPCVTVPCLERLLQELRDHPVGGLLGYPLSDTLKKVDAARQVECTVDRSQLWAAATPQMFRYGLLTRALKQMVESGRSPTDEAMAVESLGLQPKLVAGRRDNLKITMPGDLELAELILLSQQPGPVSQQQVSHQRCSDQQCSEEQCSDEQCADEQRSQQQEHR